MSNRSMGATPFAGNYVESVEGDPDSGFVPSAGLTKLEYLAMKIYVSDVGGDSRVTDTDKARRAISKANVFFNELDDQD